MSTATMRAPKNLLSRKAALLTTFASFTFVGCMAPGEDTNRDHDVEAVDSAQQALVACSPPQAPFPISCYDDADGDGHGIGSSKWVWVCSGGCESNGYAETGDDCDDANSSSWQILKCYGDADGDHFGTGALVDVCVGDHCAEGTSGYSYNSGDCNDADATIHPQQLEIEADGIDNDCENGVDQAEFYFHDPAVSTNTGSSITMNVRLQQSSERAAAFINNLSAKIYYKKLANASAGWQTYPTVGTTPMTILTCGVGQLCKGSVTLPNLDPLSVYTVQIEFYRTNNGSRIYPFGKTILDCPIGASSECFNTDVFYSMTKGADSGPLRDARWGIVMTALHRYGMFRNTDMGYWNYELMYELELAKNDTAYCSEFYSAAAKDYLISMNPCKWESLVSTLHCDPAETTKSEHTVTNMMTWFDGYGGSQSYEYMGPDMSALRPGDWLGVNPTLTEPNGQHTQMFLAWDGATNEYWLVEGNGGITATWNQNPKAKYDHSINVKSHHHCKDDTSTDPTCGNGEFYVQRVGELSVGMIDP